MPKSKPGGAMFFRRRPIIRLTCGPVDGKSTPSGSQKLALPQSSKDLPHVSWWTDLFVFFHNWCDFLQSVSCSETRRGHHLFLIAKNLPGRMVVFCHPFPDSAAKNWSRLVLPSRYHLWGWGDPPVHYHAIRGMCLWGLNRRSLTAIWSLPLFRCPTQ